MYVYMCTNVCVDLQDFLYDFFLQWGKSKIYCLNLVYC